MTAQAERIDATALHGELARVNRAEGDALRVSAAGGEYRARRAASCLLAPSPGDLVMVATSARGDCWVLAVLERAEEGATALEVDGDLTLRARGGAVTVAADEGVRVASGAEVSVVAPSVRVAADAVKGVFETMALLGAALEVDAGRVRAAAGVIDTVAERVSAKAQRVYRVVEEFEQVRAGRLDWLARKVLSLRSEHAVIHAKQLVKVDGDQIHLG